MSFFDNARQSKFVKPEEKQENISRFAGFFLDRLSAADTPTLTQRTVTLMARSSASPVARSMLASLRDFRSLDVHVQLILNQLDPAELLTEWIELGLLNNGANSVPEIRWARNPALADAHEQMVLGTSFSWHGDCMRRDPETRDAFESFECFNAAAAHRASLSFAALWSKCQAVAVIRPQQPAQGSSQVPHDVLNPLGGHVLPGVAGVIVSTRH